MNGSAIAALLPVIALIGTGFGVARAGLVRQTAVKDMSNLVFLLLLPALLFRTMAQVHVGELDYRPIGVYFLRPSSCLWRRCWSMASTHWLRRVDWPACSAMLP
jgi:predicted permease